MASSNNFIQELRDKLSLAEIVGKKVRWDQRKSNQIKGNFWACCPFHDEKTASFKVDDVKGFYYCFGCHEKGDCITFIRKTENLDFLSAIKRLASEAGVQIPNSFETKQISVDGKSRQTLVDIHELAVKFYSNELNKRPSNNASNFINNRIVSQTIIANFRIGFAPEGKKNLFNFLNQQGYDTELIVKSGLCARNDNGEIFDRFRNRIIFPIINQKGEVVGLGGRALSSTANAKYLNSPETEIFHKGKLLFNQNNCTSSAQNTNQVTVVEGYMDVIALAKIGLTNCVAPLGTAVTAEQLQKIWRMSNNPIFAFDGDTSGEKALIRLAFLSLPLISAEKTIQACKLPTGQDPDDLVTLFGKERLVELLAQPQSLLEIIWEHETKGATYKTPENRVSLENKLSTILKKMTDVKLRSHFSSAFYELKQNLFRQGQNSYSNFLKSQSIPQDNAFKKTSKKLERPTSGAKKSLLASSTKPDSMESRFQETAIIISLINHPKLIRIFSLQLDEIEFLFIDLKNIYQKVLSLTAKEQLSRDELLEKLNKISGHEVYRKLISTGHLKVNPFLKQCASFEEAKMALDDVLTRKIARQNMVQELADAQDEIRDKGNEALTWRLDQANQFLHQAQSGRSIPDPFHKKDLEQDIKKIKDLIKDEIWIKRKSKNKTNH